MMDTQSNGYLLEVPLGQKVKSLALKFSSEQVNLGKGKRVYFNTLAVWAVNHFLEEMEIETAISASDSWNPGTRAVFNVSDLALPNIGKLECCPVFVSESTVSLPETKEDRIAYIAVRLVEPFDRAKILGFIPREKVREKAKCFPLEDISPIEKLSDYLDRIELESKSI
jgi:hypothetical protein